MYPHPVTLFGFQLAIWNASFLVAIAISYLVFRDSLRTQSSFRHPVLRYLGIVYLSALAAQVFAYSFDANGSLLPPPGKSIWSYYFNPISGPKTLYGVIVLMPLSVAPSFFGTGLGLRRALDLCTPAMFSVLTLSRVGCFLEGCCYGARSDNWGVSFPVGSPVYYQQLRTAMIAPEDIALPVVPTQAIEAAFLAALAVWAKRAESTTRSNGVFIPAIACYSVFRFIIEIFRADAERGIYGPLATSQWIAAAVLLGTALFVWTRRLSHRKKVQE
jgi:prolipoprotein diacylglyceryltransferase